MAIVIKDKINKLISLLDAGRDSLMKAGQLLVEMVNENENTYAEIIAAYPSMTPGGLANLERIGRGLITPEAFMDCSPAGRAVRMLPPSVQRTVYTKPIDVVSKVGDKIVVQKKTVAEISAQEVPRVFTESGIRTPKQQEQILQSKQKAKTFVAPPYRIEGFKVYIRRNVVLTRDELADILEKMPKQNGHKKAA